MLINYKKLLSILFIVCSFSCFAQESNLQITDENNNVSSSQDIHLPIHNIYAVTGLGTVNSNNFWGNIKISTGYLNYNFYPFYLGGGLGFEIGIPSEDFPFHLKVDGTDTGAPLMLNFAPTAIGGVHYLFEKPQILAFFELQLGLNIRYLSSSYIQHPYVGNATPSVFGAQWKYLRASFDIQLDTEFVYSIGGTIGVVFNILSK